MNQLSIEAINELRRNARSVIRELGLLNDAYFDIGVTLAERHLLIELTTRESPTMGEIAECLLLDKSTISRLIAKAVKKGYVRCIADEKDKRKRFLHMTDKGRQTLNAFEPIAFNQTKEALLTLTAEEIGTVYQGLLLYAKGLRTSRLHRKDAPINLTESSHNRTELDSGKKIESLHEIYRRLDLMGLVLEPFENKDEKELYTIFQEVVKSGSQFPYESSSLKEFHCQFFHKGGQTYVCRSIDGDVIGGFYLKPNLSGRSDHIANAAYMIKDTYRGKGIGSLLIKASLHLAKDLGFRAMQFNMVLSQNTLAIKLYEKLGFSITGTLPDAVRNPDGSYQSGVIMYRLLNDLIAFNC